MGAWGIMRSTVDLDFLVSSADLDKIENGELERDKLLKSKRL